MLEPHEIAEVALVADNPGDWLLHCHVLEHHEAGMACVVRVA
jgi:FtsP/CotA-like multicopper oxidase with cupredoxin domain